MTKNPLLNKTLSLVAFYGYGVFVALVSLQPIDSVTVGQWDKLAHFVTYGLFALLAKGLSTTVGAYGWYCVGAIAYGCLMEVGQSFVPGRFMSLGDVVANTAGVLVVGLVVRKWCFTATKTR